MSKIIKFLFYSILILLVIWLLLGAFLYNFGFETKRFNSLIIEQVKKYNEDINLDIKKVKIYLNISDLTNPKIVVRSKDPTIVLGKKKLELESISTNIGIVSYFKDKFILEDFFISTKDNKIKDLISIAALQNPSIIIYNAFLKDGYANAFGSINFDENGKIIDFNLRGEIKDGKIKFNNKFDFNNINFDFTYNKDQIFIENVSLDYKKLNFLSDQIHIETIGPDGERSVGGDIRNEKTSTNSNLFTSLFEDDYNFIKDQEISFETKTEFYFKIQKGKIKKLKYSSKIDLDNIILSPENNLLKNYFDSYNNLILLANNSIKLEYKNKKLNVDGTSDYSFDTLYDKIDYKISKKDKIDNYNFLAVINFDKNSLKIKPIEYSKEKNKKSNLKLKGSYSKNSDRKIKFNEIIYKEDQNFFEVTDLNLNNDFKITDLNKLNVNYLNDNNKKNEFEITKDLDLYSINGKSFDSYKLINGILFSDNDKSFLDKFSLNEETKLGIYINKVFLDEENFSKNLFGELTIKNNKVYSLSLNSVFENNEKFKLDVKTLKNKQKVTSFYSDNAEPFVKHFKFIKGFKEGKIDFYSVKKNNVSNSSLNIFDFKVKEMPALTKLLSLASLQGIADLMTGEGIRFKEFEMNFKNEKKLMTIDEIYAIGSAISILMNGYIDNGKLVSLRGTLVPATTLNKIIGSLPLIGKILVGKKTGEGVFGVSFKIKGPPKNLKTTVNPIKTLTPRFITRTIEKAKKN